MTNPEVQNQGDEEQNLGSNVEGSRATPELKAVESDECGCIGLGRAIHFCPTHAAAPALHDAALFALAALRAARDANPTAWDNCVTPNICTAWDKLRVALALAQGQDKQI
jgi:hypothetical protein